MKYFILSACFFLLIGAGCKKNRTQKPKTELEKLPPVTQTGANTFGCLINGEAFIPGGGGPFDKVLTVQYDPTFEGGQFSINTQRIFGSNKYISLSIHANGINETGTYDIGILSKYWVYYDDLTNNSCYFETINTTPISGKLVISKFDIYDKIVSGTFTFKVKTDQCGEIEVTYGRFDVKY